MMLTLPNSSPYCSPLEHREKNIGLMTNAENTKCFSLEPEHNRIKHLLETVLKEKKRFNVKTLGLDQVKQLKVITADYQDYMHNSIKQLHKYKTKITCR